MTGILNILAGSIAAAIKDGYFNLTTLLLSGDGTNGAQNNTFLDSSTNNFSITRNGNTTQGTFSPFSQTGWSNYFDGSSYLSFASNANLAIGTGDYTFECWVFVSTLANGTVYGAAASGGPVFNLSLAAGSVSLNPYGGGNTFSTSYTFAVGNWYHVAFSRSSNSLRVFINGTQIGSTTTDTTNYTQTAMSVASAGGIQNFTGYVSNLRFVKGSALYTANFTPSTTPLTAVTNTQLLTCQSNRFVDNSSNAFAITVNGSPSIQAFSPFAPTAAYSAATNGGSGYFDGSGDYLTWTGTAAGSGAFSYEFWIYSTNGFATSRSPLGVISTSGYNSALEVRMSGTTINASQYNVANNNFTVPTLQANMWNHVVVCRNSSNQMTVFLNGTRSSTGALTISTNFSGLTSAIGRLDPSNGGDVTGYIAGIRLITGSTPYDPTQSTITMPTSPPAVATGTQFLANFTNGGITDATGKNVLETVGNAQISTTQSKFGGSSMYFDGTGDSLKGKLNNAIGGGDYTIEGWLYTGASGARYIFDMRETSQYLGAFTVGTTLYVNLGTTLDIVASTSFTQNAWVHFAIVRSGSSTNNTSVFLGGSRVLQTTDTTNYSIVPTLYIGNDNTGSYSWNGYIDDFRITKGYARYSGSTYTVPTAAFPLQ